MPTEMELTLEQTQQGVSHEVSVCIEGVMEQTHQGVSYEVSNIRVNSFTMKMEILLEPTSNKLIVGRSSRIRRKLKDGGEVKEFQRSFRHSDTERLSRSDEVLKLKNFKKDATLKLFKSTNQERYEHVGPEVTSYTRWQDSLR
ncbi:hypothetical protein Tco_0044874 [Tanacetum coccineum]